MASPKFLEHNRIKLNDHHAIRFQKACIATKDKYRIPEFMNSLNRSEYLLPDDFFKLNEMPTELLVIGTERIGLEIAQGLARLGCQVSVMESQNSILSFIDHDCVIYLEQKLKKEGVRFFKNTKMLKMTKDEKQDKIVVHFEKIQGIKNVLKFNQVLVNQGKQPNISNLDLQNA